MGSGEAQKRKRVAILISGRGSNMAALIQAAQSPGYPAEIVFVLSNRTDAAGLGFAQQHGIETLALSHKAFDKREAFDRAMHSALQVRGIELVALAGFMRVLSPWFCQQWQGRLINIHPSLLPAFKGLNTHRQALEAGVTEHGCTVHFVTADLDDGDIVLQATVPVLPGDDENTLAARVLVQEHVIYAKALAKVAAALV